MLFNHVCQVTAVDVYVVRESGWIRTRKIRQFPPECKSVYVYSERTSDYRARRKLNSKSNPGSSANGLTYPPLVNENIKLEVIIIWIPKHLSTTVSHMRSYVRLLRLRPYNRWN